MGGLIRAFSHISSYRCEGYCRRLLSCFSPHQITPYLAHFSSFQRSISHLDNNILRILRTGIDYLSQYSPLHKVGLTGSSITLRSRYAGHEHIKIEAAMFDGLAFGPKSGGKDVQLHISLLFDIYNEEGREVLEFLCSAWPDALEIQNVYIFKPGDWPNKICMGPNVRDLKVKLRNEFYDFLNKSGVTDQRATFLHQYMMNKDRIELVHWLGKVELFIEK